MSLQISTESPITKSSVGFPISRKDPALQAWINSTGPGLSSQSAQVKHESPLAPHPDYTLKGAAPVKKVANALNTINFNQQ